MVKAIILDYDGVIADSFPAVHKVYQEICSTLGKPCPATLGEFRLWYGDSSRDFMKRVGFTSEDVAYADALYKEKIELQVVDFFPGISKVIATLSSQYQLFVVSSSPQEEINSRLIQHGLADYFQEILGCKVRGEFTKSPHLKYIQEKYSLAGSDLVYIGDRIVDYFQAKTAGVESFFLVEYGWGYDLTRIPDHIQRVCIQKPEDILKCV